MTLPVTLPWRQGYADWHKPLPLFWALRELWIALHGFLIRKRLADPRQGYASQGQEVEPRQAPEGRKMGQFAARLWVKPRQDYG